MTDTSEESLLAESSRELIDPPTVPEPMIRDLNSEPVSDSYFSRPPSTGFSSAFASQDVVFASQPFSFGTDESHAPAAAQLNDSTFSPKSPSRHARRFASDPRGIGSEFSGLDVYPPSDVLLHREAKDESARSVCVDGAAISSDRIVQGSESSEADTLERDPPPPKEEAEMSPLALQQQHHPQDLRYFPSEAPFSYHFSQMEDPGLQLAPIPVEDEHVHEENKHLKQQKEDLKEQNVALLKMIEDFQRREAEIFSDPEEPSSEFGADDRRASGIPIDESRILYPELGLSPGGLRSDARADPRHPYQTAEELTRKRDVRFRSEGSSFSNQSPDSVVLPHSLHEQETLSAEARAKLKGYYDVGRKTMELEIKGRTQASIELRREL